MLTKKQELFYQFILNCTNELEEIPSIGYLKKKSSYKSYNTIYKYLAQLQKKGYLDFNQETKKITYLKNNIKTNSTLKIPLLNEHKFIEIPKKYLKDKEYIAFLVHDNRLKSYLIKNKDILIIEKSQVNLNNKLVLVKLENQYKVLQYLKKDGYIHLLNDKELHILTRSENVYGKVVSVIRTTMD